MKNDFANILAILGGVFIGCALMDELSKTEIPELEKLISDMNEKNIPLLTDGEKSEDKPKSDKEQKEVDIEKEIEELKQKLAEYKNKNEESKQKEPKEWGD